MNVASLDLCRELYELSGWEGTEKAWFEFADGMMPSNNSLKPEQYKRWICRAYDLGYLLRKLPKIIDGDALSIGANNTTLQWSAEYGFGIKIDRQFADTPEDALTKLATELFKNGILTRESLEPSDELQQIMRDAEADYAAGRNITHYENLEDVRRDLESGDAQ